MYSGEIFDAQEGLRAGLLKAVYAPEQLLAAAYALAHKITDKRSPVAIALTRQMLYRNAAQLHPLEAHIIESLSVFYLAQKDGKEGVQAFLEKREPQFTAKVSQDMPPFLSLG